MMEPASRGRGRRSGSTTAPMPIPPTTINSAVVGQESSSGGGGGTLDEGSDAPAASVWARIADFAAMGPKERTGWHLRRLLLQGPPLPLGADGDEVQVVHTVAVSSSGSGHLAPSTQVSHRHGHDDVTQIDIQPHHTNPRTPRSSSCMGRTAWCSACTSPVLSSASRGRSSRWSSWRARWPTLCGCVYMDVYVCMYTSWQFSLKSHKRRSFGHSGI